MLEPPEASKVFVIFDIKVELSARSVIINKLGKIVEVQGHFSGDFVCNLKNQHEHELLIDLVDGLLVFQMSSSSVIDCLHVLEPQVAAYLHHHCLEDAIATKTSSSLFHVPQHVRRIFHDFNIH
ncbi:hypothetical protein GOP47_0019159, partial [Adiantum capillus-veneris]